jgi:hypothetical protein
MGHRVTKYASQLKDFNDLYFGWPFDQPIL